MLAIKVTGQVLLTTLTAGGSARTSDLLLTAAAAAIDARGISMMDYGT